MPKRMDAPSNAPPIDALERSNFLACLHHLFAHFKGTDKISEDTLPAGLRVHHLPGLEFSSSDIAKIQHDERGVFTVWANFLGLTDSQSPIPDYLTHDIVRCDDKAQRTRDYFNLFHHRLYELLFFGLKAIDLPLAWSHKSHQSWRRRVCALLGLIDPADDPGVTRSLLSALLVQSPSARVVEAALKGSLTPFLQRSKASPASLKLESLCGEQVPLDQAYQNQLGRQNHQLGKDCVLGDHVTDRTSKIRIIVSDLEQTQLGAFEEGAPAYELLRGQLQLLLDRPTKVELVLHLHPQAAAHWAREQATLGQGRQILSSQPKSTRRVLLNFAPLGGEPGLSLS